MVKTASPQRPARMRAAILAPVLALLPALLLAGCVFFTSSLFPGFLAQVEQSYDLEGKIDSFLAGVGSADYRWYAHAFLLTSLPGTDYGGVLIELESLPNRLLLLADPSGNVQMLDNPNFGFLHLRDVNGDFMVGSNRFPPASLVFAAYTASVSKDYVGFSDGSSNYLLHSDQMNSNRLYWQPFASNWAAGATDEREISSTQYGFQIKGAWYDPLAAADKAVAMVFFNASQNRVYVFRTPVPGSMVGPLLASYPPVVLESYDANRTYYTRKGIVAADRDGTVMLLDFNGNETGKRLDLGATGEPRLAFDLEGEHFYLFNPEDQMLYRGETGW
jgi:hypothetical protein